MILARRVDAFFDRYILDVFKTGGYIKNWAGESHKNGRLSRRPPICFFNIYLSDKHTYLGFNYI